jgi:hypothetical protein
MNAEFREHEWIEANQQYLVEQFARLKALLSGQEKDAAIFTPEDPGLNARAYAIDIITESFGFSPFERDLLLLCAGVEMDAELAGLCAAAQGHPQRTYATFSLALGALQEPHWSALAPNRPLRHWRFIEVNDDVGLASARLRIDERVLHFLAGVDLLDLRLQPLLRIRGQAEIMAMAHQQVTHSIIEALTSHQAPAPMIQLIGDDSYGQEDVAAAITAHFGVRLMILSTEDVPGSAQELDAFVTLWLRESVLYSCALLILAADASVPASVSRLAERASGLVFYAAREPLSLRRPSLRFQINKPSAADQKQLWQTCLGSVARRLNGSLDGVSSQFRLSAQTIAVTGEALQTSLAVSELPDTTFWQACRSLGRPRLDDLAQRLDPAASWNDLILPEPQKNTLRQIASHLRHQLRVYEEWGFAQKGSRGLGLSTLFCGESGTGKTMAAEVLAKELHLDLYRIDLSSVVSKYIGDTEKNLRRVFDAAEDCGAILLFDEADALFGKRSEVKDSHDRYANIEVSYLLQRMEAYRGLAILTTNMKTALDTAFQRRLRFVIQFPFPDQSQREAIWRGVFPSSTPVEGIDFMKLARLNVAGGNIRNIALNAAFLAAESDEPVGMEHLLSAAHSEAGKRERTLADAETRGWV